MRFLSLAALEIAFVDLFTKRHSALVLSSAGKTYEPVLLEKKALIDALPAALTGGKPLVEEIADADVIHDGFGAAIQYLGQAYERWPNVPPEVLAAIKRIQAAFITELDDLEASYADEAHATRSSGPSPCPTEGASRWSGPVQRPSEEASRSSAPSPRPLPGTKGSNAVRISTRVGVPSLRRARA